LPAFCKGRSSGVNNLTIPPEKEGGTRLRGLPKHKEAHYR
jgi:hypothetical protein